MHYNLLKKYIYAHELVVLDLDGTITEKDTLVDFSIFVFHDSFLKLAILLILYALIKLKLLSNVKFKILYSRFILKRTKVEQIQKYTKNWFEQRGIFLIREIFKNEWFIKYPNKVIVSSNFDFLVNNFANYLRVGNVIATKPEVKNDVYTGKIGGDIPSGEKKLKLLLSKYDFKTLNLKAIGLGNDKSDFEILKAVKTGILIRKGKVLFFKK